MKWDQWASLETFQIAGIRYFAIEQDRAFHIFRNGDRGVVYYGSWQTIEGFKNRAKMPNFETMEIPRPF